MITFENKLIETVVKSKQYLDIVKNLEDAFGGIMLEVMYDYPQAMFNLLELESEVDWDDTIWDLVYQGSEKAAKQAYCEIKKLQGIEN